MGRSMVAAVAVATVTAAVLTGTGVPVHAVPASTSPAPTQLTTNHLAGPVDVDASSSPVFGWAVGAGAQSAYEIQVAASADELGEDGETWDSAKVASAANTSITYSGPALTASEGYDWRVRTWDAQGQASAWSDPAEFGTGPGSTWAGATPIWTPATSVSDDASLRWSDYTLSGTFTVGATPAAQVFSVTFRAKDTSNFYLWQFSPTQIAPQIQVNGTFSNLKNPKWANYPSGFTATLGTAYDFKITAIGSTFTTWLRPHGGTTWTQVDQTTDTTFATGGIGVRTGGTEGWTLDNVLVTSEVAGDSSGTTLYSNDFGTANTDFACGTVTNGALSVGASKNCLMVPAGVVTVSTNWAFLRGSVTLADKPIAWAHLYATGASTSGAKQFVYKMSLNGDFVGTGPTRSIGSETRYDGFDVTHQLKQGKENVVGVLAYTTSTKKFLADLVVRYADGTTQTFGTGSGWKAMDGSYALPASASVGTSSYVLPQENFNAAHYPFGFDQPGFDDSSWAAATTQAAFGTLTPTPTAKVQRTLQKPASVTEYSPGSYLVDYGRTWMGGLSLTLDGTAGEKVDIRYGQVLSGTNAVKYVTAAGNRYEDTWTLKDGEQRLETWGPRVFRYVQVTGAPAGLTADDLTAEAYLYPFDESAAQFDSSDAGLNQVWQFSKNTVETANQDVYVDSWERERTVYEADGYLQQLENLYTGGDSALADYSFDYLLANRTWPTEWPIYDVLAAYDSYMATGDASHLAANYTALKGKLPTKWYDATSGLIHKTTGNDGSSGCGNDCDIVDWPAGSRDGYVFTSYNTVINAISYRAFTDMAALATATGNTSDATTYSSMAATIKTAVNNSMWDATTGAYADGLQNDGVTRIPHDAVQASAFAVAFGLADADRAAQVASYLDDRNDDATDGIACSVYCAAFLVEALYDGNDGQAGQDMLTSTAKNSWLHEISLGAGAAMEAWDPSEKSNLSYSHPWGASPAYNIPQDLFGIKPTTPGYATFQVKPQRGSIAWAHITVPTQNGGIGVAFDADGDGTDAGVDVPANTSATVYLPVASSSVTSVYVDGARTGGTYSDGFLAVDGLAPGCHILTAQAGAAPYADSRLTDICSEGYSAPDLEAPTMTATADPAGADGWYGAGAQVTLAAEDVSGVASIEYQLDGGAWTTYAGPIALPDGTHTVGYRATDTVGNTSTPGELVAKVDGIAPSVDATVSTDRVLTVTGADTGSGLGSLEYAIDDGGWMSYTQPVQLDGRGQTVHVRATDVAGNTSERDLEVAVGKPVVASPSNVTAPTLSGTAKVGGTLVATPGTWRDADGATYGYQWLRNGAAIPGATGTTYRLVAADAGTQVAVQVAVTKPGVAGAAASSAPVQVRKLVAKVKLRLARSTISRGTKGRATVKVKAPGTTVRGMVVIKVGSKTIKTVRLRAGGEVVIKIPALSVGRHKLKAVYQGSASVAPAHSAKVRLTVRR